MLTLFNMGGGFKDPRKVEINRSYVSKGVKKALIAKRLIF